MVTTENTAMPTEEQSNGSVGLLEDDANKPMWNPLDSKYRLDASKAQVHISNDVDNDATSPDEVHDQLTQMVMELTFHNDFLKAQIGTIKSPVARSVDASMQDDGNAQDGGASEQVSRLHEEIKGLQKEVHLQKETQKAAEDALEHLRVAYSDADAKVQELSSKLFEVQQKMEREIKERDDKYVELDTKFGRLHKRAKQRIQDLQKEKEDLEARLHDVNLTSEQALNQQALAHQEIERTRQQTNEALRAMDAERQQLRTTNNKLRDSVDEMRRSLEAKEYKLEELQQSILDKEKMLEDTRSQLQALEEKRQASISEFSAKYQKQVESLEAQIADALSERSKAVEAVSSLEILLGEKDAKIAELDAAASGEAVRLGAALEELRGELVHLKDKHEKERESLEAACQALRAKLEALESACLCSEIEAAKRRSQLELELSTQKQLLNTRDAELIAAKDEIKHLENEFSAYKVRAHALLQKKDVELSAAKNSDVVMAQEEAIREAEKEVAIALAERDKAIQELQDVLINHEKEIAARVAALSDAEQRIGSIAMKLDSATTNYLSEKEEWQKNLDNVEESWRLKYSALEAQNNEHIRDDPQKALEELQLRYRKLKEEHDSFREIADKMIEGKEMEIAKLIQENKDLHESTGSRQFVGQNGNYSASIKQDVQLLSIAAAEQQILILARQQAQREEELAQSQRHILALQEEIEELERENRLHSQQEAVLKTELRNVERSQKREGVDMTYLKNVVLKLLETGEVEALLPVVATLLQFSPEETKKCQHAFRASDASLSSASSLADVASTPRSLFSRFSFT